MNRRDFIMNGLLLVGAFAVPRPLCSQRETIFINWHHYQCFQTVFGMLLLKSGMLIASRSLIEICLDTFHAIAAA
jgi:hypothetical protein